MIADAGVREGKLFDDILAEIRVEFGLINSPKKKMCMITLLKTTKGINSFQISLQLRNYYQTPKRFRIYSKYT